MSMARIALGGFLSLALCFLVASCGRLSQENYRKIKVGMSYQEVERILGSGPTCNSAMGMNTCTWGTKEKFVKVQFVGDAVVMYSAKGLN